MSSAGGGPSGGAAGGQGGQGRGGGHGAGGALTCDAQGDQGAHGRGAQHEPATAYGGEEAARCFRFGRRRSQLFQVLRKAFRALRYCWFSSAPRLIWRRMASVVSSGASR